MHFQNIDTFIYQTTLLQNFFAVFFLRSPKAFSVSLIKQNY